MRADDGLPVQIPRTFKQLSGSAANLAVTNGSQAVTLTQVIPQGGCNVRIAVNGSIGVHIRIGASAAATTNDTLLLGNTVEVFTIDSGDAITAILDSGTSGTTINCTLGMGA
jgi:hypothetical protein